MERLIKYVLKFHREKVLNAVILDYFGSIPTNVSEPAIGFLEEKRNAIDKWLIYQSYVLQRRMVHDPKNAQVIFGMLLELKLMKQMIAAGKELPPEVEGTKTVGQVRKEREEREAEAAKELEEALKGAKEFAAGLKKK